MDEINVLLQTHVSLLGRARCPLHRRLLFERGRLFVSDILVIHLLRWRDSSAVSLFLNFLQEKATLRLLAVFYQT